MEPSHQPITDNTTLEDLVDNSDEDCISTTAQYDEEGNEAALVIVVKGQAVPVMRKVLEWVKVFSDHEEA